EAGAAVVALDRHNIRHAEAHEGVAYLGFEKEPLDPRKVGVKAVAHRPADDVCRLVELVEERRSGDVDVDPLGIRDAAAGELAWVYGKDGIIAARSGLKEGRRLEASEVGGELVPVAGGALVQQVCRIERKQHRNWARGDIGKESAGELV